MEVNGGSMPQAATSMVWSGYTYMYFTTRFTHRQCYGVSQ